MRRGSQCGAPLGTTDEAVAFVTTAQALPVVPGYGEIWTHCPRRTCGAWNRFTRLAKEQAS
ncbi:MAG TPA: hypothetical protein VE861_04195 [Gemmatimonadaceae bacterium]|nr:hypothetical protein [Gemmatimonadaceae bacterium]